jgi:hypothetical protein
VTAADDDGIVLFSHLTMLSVYSEHELSTESW